MYQPENWKNGNDPDLVQTIPKKWWVEWGGDMGYIRIELYLLSFLL